MLSSVVSTARGKTTETMKTSTSVSSLCTICERRGGGSYGISHVSAVPVWLWTSFVYVKFTSCAVGLVKIHLLFHE